MRCCEISPWGCGGSAALIGGEEQGRRRALAVPPRAWPLAALSEALG